MEAVRRVTVELANILAPFWDHIAITGGLAAYLLVPQHDAVHKHRGTTDVDLILDHRNLAGATYLTIREILMRHLYQEDVQKAFRWHRGVLVDGKSVDVPVDFLAGEYGGTPRERGHQDIEDILPLKTHGAEIAFLHPIDRELAAPHPEGGMDRVVLHVASVPAVILLKGHALGRMEDKDPYDICYLIRTYPGGIRALAGAFRPYMELPAAREALRAIRAKFDARDAVGVVAAAREMGRVEGGEPEVHKTMAFELANALLRELGLP